MSREAEKPEAPAPVVVSVAEHWRAGPFVRRAKGVGGLGGFLLAALGGMSAGEPLAEILWHGLVAGLVGMFVLWGAAVLVWRQLVPAETRYLAHEVIETRRRLLAEQSARMEAAEAARKQQAPQLD